MKNPELARIFDEIADLMEIIGEDKFRINSYRKVARVLEELPEDVEELLKKGKLTKIPGIGERSLKRIEEYLKTGKIQTHQDLLSKIPITLLDLVKIPGLGPKGVALLWKELGITTIDELKDALDSGKIEKLPGMGSKKVENIKQGLEFLKKTAGRTPLGDARPLAMTLLEKLKKLKGTIRAELAGSIRRWAETIGDMDILVISSNGERILKEFTEFEEVKEVLAAGKTKASVVITGDIQVDVRVVPKESFGSAWQYFTGSKAHNIKLREIAVKRKWKLNEYGLFDEKEKQIAGKDEESIYKALGLPWIAPELREDRGEIESAIDGRLPKLLEPSDIRGDLHIHTKASDGSNSIEEIVMACIKKGYEYLCITDHSKSSVIANGLDEKRLEKHIKEIRKIAEKYKDEILVLAGTEVDILADGSLDYPDSLLSELDLVTASIHSGLGQPQEKITSRILKAMDNPHVDTIGHPTGRLLGQREPSNIDIVKIIRHAKETGTWLELNASWQRLDLKDVHLREAKEHNVKVCISTDAHDIYQLDYMIYGIYTARRGWLEKSDVINTLPRDPFREVITLPKESRQKLIK